MKVERVYAADLECAIIVRNSYRDEGIVFFTENNYSQQLAYMNRPKGYEIDPHVHNPITRTVKNTNEVLFVKSGKVRVDFYDTEKNYVDFRLLEKGDVILLIDGGHGFRFLEDSEMIEVKQGPYAGEKDKTRFKR
jgi:mannose-6-phosphate isomerase-like protein (cupin superfamily)